MQIDKFGVAHRTTDELCDLLYANPNVDLNKVQVDDPEIFNRSIKELYSELSPLQKYQLQSDIDIETFDSKNQRNWYMPEKYKELDIAQWLLAQCHTTEEIQRVGAELLMFGERDLLDLLKYMKYFVETLRENNVVWGVGRGSSVASFCLFLIGVHRINSLFYSLEIEEFLK